MSQDDCYTDGTTQSSRDGTTQSSQDACYTYGTGGVTQLQAFGNQDANYLNGEGVNFFDKGNIQHTYFNLVYNSYVASNNGDPTWPFRGQAVQFKLNPKVSGDLLGNVFLKLTMPALPVGDDAGQPEADPPLDPKPFSYCDRLGYAILDKITMSVNGEVIDTVWADWLVIQNEVFADDSIRRATDSIINAGLVEGDPLSINPATAQKEIPLYIPLTFFFCRNHYHTTTKANTFKPFFYTCAALEQEIIFTAFFKEQAFFTNYTAEPLTINKIFLVTEEIVLTRAERNYYRDNHITSVVDVVDIQPKLDMDEQPGQEVSAATRIYPNLFKDFLVCNRPVKSIHFFLRRYNYEVDMRLPFWQYRMDFSTMAQNINNNGQFPVAVDYDVYKEDANQVLENATLFIMNESRYTESSSKYLKNITTISHELNPPLRNIYTYSFAIHPKDPVPNGSVNFAQLQTGSTVIFGEANFQSVQYHNYIVNLFYVANKIIEYDNGFVRTRFM